MCWGRATPVARLCFYKRRSRHWSGAPPARHDDASSIPERVAPLLDHVGDALVDFRDARADRLDLADRLGARRRRDLRTQWDGEVLGVDLRRLDRIEVLHEELGGVEVLGALDDRRRRDDQRRTVARIGY